MENKKTLQSAHSHNATKFVASEPLEVVVGELESFPRLELELLKVHPNHCDYRATFKDDSKGVPIFVLMQRWNRTETLVTLNYYLPSPKLNSVRLMLIVSIVGILSVTSFILFNSTLAFMTIWLLMIGVMFYNQQNGMGKITKSDKMIDPHKKRIQEDLMKYIIDELDKSAELNMVQGN